MRKKLYKLHHKMDVFVNEYNEDHGNPYRIDFHL
jgi:hypothetical protein